MNLTSCDEVAGWIGALGRGKRGEGFDGPAFMRPYHFTTLANAVHLAGATRIEIPEGLVGYAARMHLWTAIGLEGPRNVNERNPGGRFCPLTPITSESSAENSADAIREVFRVAGTSDPTTLEAVGIVLSEILGNCVFHSSVNGAIKGLVCAQTWPGGNLAQVAVTDSGVGIRESLATNPDLILRLERESAVDLATQFGVTSKPAPLGQHSGYGLTLARQLMETHSGNFLLISGSEAIQVTQNGAIARNLQDPWPGTIVIMEWRIDRALDVASVYESWPLPEGMTDDDFF